MRKIAVVIFLSSSELNGVRTTMHNHTVHPIYRAGPNELEVRTSDINIAIDTYVLISNAVYIKSKPDKAMGFNTRTSYGFIRRTY